MTLRGFHAGALLAAILLLSGSVQASEEGPIGPIMEAGHRAWVEAFARGDATAVAAVYAEKASIFPPNGARVDGRDAIRKELEKYGKTKFELTTSEARQAGSTAWCAGNYRIILPDGKKGDAGKYVEIWSRTAEGWKIWRDIWNSDLPPAPAAK